jgi:hypothetical protein
VRATVTASDTRGDFRRDVVADIQDLPSQVSVGYVDEKLEDTEARLLRQQDVTYAASARIGHLDVTVDETIADVPQKSVHATATGLPRTFSARIRSDDRAGVADPTKPDAQVQARAVDYRADSAITRLTVLAEDFEDGELAQQLDGRATGVPPAFTLNRVVRGIDDLETDAEERTQRVDFAAAGGTIGALEAGVATDRPVAFVDPKPFFEAGDLGSGEEPGYAFADGDDIALRLYGLSGAVVDTAEPMVVEAAASPGPFLVRALKKPLELVGTVLDLPASAKIVFSPGTPDPADPTKRKGPQRMTFEGSAGIGTLRATATSTDPDQTLFDRVRTAKLRASAVPARLALLIEPKDPDAPAPPDGQPVTLARFDAGGGRIGLLDALLTSGPEDERLPDGTDGVLLRDLDDRYVLAGRITGLSSASVVQTAVRGDPLKVRVQDFTTTASLRAPLDEGEQRPLIVDLGRKTPKGQERTLLQLGNRPHEVKELSIREERVAFPVVNPDLAAAPRAKAIRYRADRDAGALAICQRVGAQLPDLDCAAQDLDQQIGVHGLTAKVDLIPAELDLCLASDKGDFGREGFVRRVDCLGEAPQPYDEGSLCDDTDGLQPALKLDCRNDRLLIKTSLLFSASKAVTVNLVDCQDDEAAAAGKACILESGADFMRIKDLRISKLRAQIDSPQGVGDRGYAFVDTASAPVSGAVALLPPLEKPKDTRLRANFPDFADDTEEFSADNRLVVFESQVTGENGSLDQKVFRTGRCQRGDADIEVQTVIELGVNIAPRFEVADDLC